MRMHPNYQDTYMITYYRGTSDEYKTFCSPEAYELINKMLESRKDAGEDVDENDKDIMLWKQRIERLEKEGLTSWIKRNGESPVFRNKYDKYPTKRRSIHHGKTWEQREQERIDRLQDVLPLTKGDITGYLREIRKRLKIEYIPIKEAASKQAIRTPIPTLHGLRHAHAGIINKAGKSGTMNELVSEWLQGRKLEASRQAYTSGEFLDYERLIEYWKVVGNLTIDQSDLKNTEIVELKTSLHSYEDERVVNQAGRAYLIKENENRKKEVDFLTALVTSLVPPERMEEAKRTLADSSLPLELKKANIIELPKVKDKEEGKDDS
jgi:hypothetical protein